MGEELAAQYLHKQLLEIQALLGAGGARRDLKATVARESVRRPGLLTCSFAEEGLAWQGAMAGHAGERRQTACCRRALGER